MLDAKDLQAIADLLDKKLEEKLEEKLEAKLEEKLDAKLEEKLASKFAMFKKELLEETDKRLNKRIEKCESNLLTEMERLYQRTNDKIKKLGERMERLEERYYSIRIENNTTALIMQMINTLQKDVEEIKAKIA